MMVSKMQLRSVGEMCPGYVQSRNISWTLAAENIENDVSCETCLHWKDNRCKIDLFDEVLSSLDQT
ncbi:MAG: hypothetical protein WBJ82_09785 [Tepidanaerobacteraceae bacterium]|jgi:hypothetical protein|nr:hypothetical protein [Tepidanaerobacteraceae bacterium]